MGVGCERGSDGGPVGMARSHAFAADRTLARRPVTARSGQRSAPSSVSVTLDFRPGAKRCHGGASRHSDPRLTCHCDGRPGKAADRADPSCVRSWATGGCGTNRTRRRTGSRPSARGDTGAGTPSRASRQHLSLRCRPRRRRRRLARSHGAKPEYRFHHGAVRGRRDPAARRRAQP